MQVYGPKKIVNKAWAGVLLVLTESESFLQNCVVGPGTGWGKREAATSENDQNLILMFS